MRSKQLLPALLLCCNFFSYAQKPYYNERQNFLKANSVWAFGTNAGWDFNTGTAIQTNSTGVEGYASVSDPATGRLLFYSNGQRCWNINNSIMPNGNNLLGNKGSSAQGTCIVPVLDTPGKYYLFSLPQGFAPGLYYSIVDMSLDSNRGDIDISRKNILLDKDTLTEGMIAIPGDNCDIWLLVHAYTRPEFKAYHITLNGIDTVPVISYTSGTFQALPNANNYVGSMAVSPDRKKVVITSYYSGLGFPAIYGATLAEFDAGTGIVSNTINMSLDSGGISYGAYSACFSPDNSKLYFSIATNYYVLGLYQYELSQYDSSAIANSKIFISSSLTDYGGYLKLYKDTIYVANYNLGTLSRINQPNLAGVACNFQANAITLFPGTKCGLSLNSDVVFPILSDTVFHKIDSLFCAGMDISIEALNANTGYNYTWNTGDTTSQISISEQGQSTYWVTYGDGCHHYVDTFHLEVYDVFTTITVKEFELGTTGGPFASYQWLLNGQPIPGATDSTYNVQENGDYQVIVNNEHDCTYTSDVYPVTNYTDIEKQNKAAGTIIIYPNPTNDIVYVNTGMATNLSISNLEGKMIRTNTKAKQISLKGLPKGIYFLHILDQNNKLLKVEKIVKTL